LTLDKLDDAQYARCPADRFATELPTGIIGMGARTYIPQLGRFLQTDPQPGGSANAYAYTDDNPINEADPSGEWSYNYENAETGEAAPGTPRSGNGPGAIAPPPADLQAEAEMAVDPPWDAASASTEAPEVVGEWLQPGEAGGQVEPVAAREIGNDAGERLCTDPSKQGCRVGKLKSLKEGRSDVSLVAFWVPVSP
jgi:RHS repeat-associated protein